MMPNRRLREGFPCAKQECDQDQAPNGPLGDHFEADTVGGRIVTVAVMRNNSAIAGESQASARKRAEDQLAACAGGFRQMDRHSLDECLGEEREGEAFFGFRDEAEFFGRRDTAAGDQCAQPFEQIEVTRTAAANDEIGLKACEREGRRARGEFGRGRHSIDR